MFGLDDILGGIGDVAGYFAGQNDRNSARDAIDSARREWEGIDPTVNAEQTGPSAFENAGIDSRAAQMDVLSELRNKYKSGGLDALDRGRLAEIEARTAQAGRAASEGAKQDAARRGLLKGGVGLVAQMKGGQDAAQNASQAGVQAAAEAERARRASLGQAGYMAGEVRGQDYHKAAAQDAINQFNARQRQGAREATVGNQFRRAGGISGMAGQQYDAREADAARTGRLWGGVGRMAGSVGNFFAPDPTGGGGEDWMKDSYTGGASYTAHGGVIPGEAPVPGDSYANDVVPVVASPGEVVVPRSLVEKLKQILLTPAPKPGLPPPNSSPSVFDARDAIRANRRRLDEAAEGR